MPRPPTAHHRAGAVTGDLCQWGLVVRKSRLTLTGRSHQRSPHERESPYLPGRARFLPAKPRVSSPPPAAQRVNISSTALAAEPFNSHRQGTMLLSLGQRAVDPQYQRPLQTLGIAMIRPDAQRSIPTLVGGFATTGEGSSPPLKRHERTKTRCA